MYIQKANIIEILPSGVEVIREACASIKIAGWRLTSIKRCCYNKSRGPRFYIQPIDPYKE